MSRRRGVTLMELLLASTLGAGVLFALAKVDIARILISQKTAGIAEIQLDPGLAVMHVSRSLVNADRVNVLDPSNIQIRMPRPILDLENPGLDDPANYAWVQYKLVGTDLQYLDDACAVQERFRNIQDVEIAFQEGADNMLQLRVTSTEEPKTNKHVTFTGQAVMRAGAHRNDASMNGLLPLGAGDPPDPCP